MQKCGIKQTANLNDSKSAASIDSGLQINFSEQANSQIWHPQIMNVICTCHLQKYQAPAAEGVERPQYCWAYLSASPYSRHPQVDD